MGEWVLVDGGWVPFIVVVASGGLRFTMVANKVVKIGILLRIVGGR